MIGSLPVGYVLVKRKTGRDVRKIGSGATGATNVSRVLGKKIGALVAFFDIFKGILAFYLGIALLQTRGAAEIAAIAAVVGHCFPVWIGFKGGKGVSTAFGATLVLATIPAVMAFGIFAMAAAITRRISAASITAVWTFAGFTFMLEPEISVRIMSIFLALFITFTHRQNLTRLISGTEKTFFGEQ